MSLLPPVISCMCLQGKLNCSYQYFALGFFCFQEASDYPIRTIVDNILSILKYCFLFKNRQVTGFIFQVICTIGKNSAYFFLHDTFNLMKEWGFFLQCWFIWPKKTPDTPFIRVFTDCKLKNVSHSRKIEILSLGLALKGSGFTDLLVSIKK